MLIYHLDFSLLSLPILSMKFDQIIKNLVLTKQSTLISITKTNFLMMFSEVKAVFLRIIQKPQVYCVAKLQSFVMLEQIVYTVSAVF